MASLREARIHKINTHTNKKMVAPSKLAHI